MTKAQQVKMVEAFYQAVRDGGLHGAGARAAKALGWKERTFRDRLATHPEHRAIFAMAESIDALRAEEKANPSTPAAPDPDAALRRRVVKLEGDLAAATRQLRSSDVTAGIVAQLIPVIENTVKPLVVSPYATQPHTFVAPSGMDTPPEVVDAVVTMSDQHADKVVSLEGVMGLEQYDNAAFNCRLWEWAKMIQRYCTVHLPRYTFDTLWVLHLGDAVNGDIHDHKLRNDFPNSLVAAMNVADAQAQALAYLAPHFNHVNVVCVSGNHGRTTTKIVQEDPFDNFDYLVARHMQARCAGIANIHFTIPRAWTTNIEIRGKLVQLNHGHGVKGTWGIPWYGFERREGRMQALAEKLGRRIDYFFYGHFHTDMRRSAGSGKAFHAGSWYMTDEYAMNMLAVGNEPEQTLLVWSDRFGPQIQIPLFVRDKEREAKMRAGEWTPPFGGGV